MRSRSVPLLLVLPASPSSPSFPFLPPRRNPIRSREQNPGPCQRFRLGRGHLWAQVLRGRRYRRRCRCQFGGGCAEAGWWYSRERRHGEGRYGSGPGVRKGAQGIVDALSGLEAFEISDQLREVIGGLLLNLFGAMLPTKAGVRVGNGKTATAACSGAVGATGGRNDGISSLRFHFFLRDVGYHTPGGFWQRVRKRLKTNEIAFCAAQKSGQATGSKGDRAGKGAESGRANGLAGRKWSRCFTTQDTTKYIICQI